MRAVQIPSQYFLIHLVSYIPKIACHLATNPKRISRTFSSAVSIVKRKFEARDMWRLVDGQHSESSESVTGYRTRRVGGCKKFNFKKKVR